MPRSLHFFHTCDDESTCDSNDESSHVGQEVTIIEDDISLAEPQPLQQSYRSNQLVLVPENRESEESLIAVNTNELLSESTCNSEHSTSNACAESSSLPAMGPYDLGALRTSFLSGTLSQWRSGH